MEKADMQDEAGAPIQFPSVGGSDGQRRSVAWPSLTEDRQGEVGGQLEISGSDVSVLFG
jgi:hypothetical protein